MLPQGMTTASVPVAETEGGGTAEHLIEGIEQEDRRRKRYLLVQAAAAA